MVQALALVIPLSTFLATAVLSAPSFPNTTYYGQWTHQLGSLSPYPGRVLSASIGEQSIPDGRIPSQDVVKQALAAGKPLTLEVLQAGPEPLDLTHLFAIYDQRPSEILFLGVQGPDLVLRRRTISGRLQLDQPEVRWAGALAGEIGDTIQIAFWKKANSSCLRVNSLVRCNLLPGVEGGWRLLYNLGSGSPLLAGGISLFWMVALSIPIGLVFRNLRTATLYGGFLGTLSALISLEFPWLAVHAITVGLSFGRVMGRLPGVPEGENERYDHCRFRVTPLACVDPPSQRRSRRTSQMGRRKIRLLRGYYSRRKRSSAGEMFSNPEYARKPDRFKVEGTSWISARSLQRRQISDCYICAGSGEA